MTQPLPAGDFTQAKAWSTSPVAIDSQGRLAIVTGILIAILLHTTMGQHGIADVKALKKQHKRQTAKPDAPGGTDRPDGMVPLFRYTSKDWHEPHPPPGVQQPRGDLVHRAAFGYHATSDSPAPRHRFPSGVGWFLCPQVYPAHPPRMRCSTPLERVPTR